MYEERETEIWVVDDDPSLKEAMKVILEEEGYEVDTFDNSTDLFHHIKTRNPAVILLDVILGRENGLEICKNIKNRFDTSVILVSANNFTHKELNNSKADVFIQKPFELKTLVLAVESLT
jgi:two-component system alkaline phosphatase synthesis response regulator PhoP